MNLDLSGKVAVVTGSSRGLGFASATSLIQEGCSVAICARGEERLAQAATHLRETAGDAERVLAVQADLTTAAGVEHVITRTVERFGGLDILVNNVGLARGGSIEETSDDQW